MHGKGKICGTFTHLIKNLINVSLNFSWKGAQYAYCWVDDLLQSVVEKTFITS